MAAPLPGTGIGACREPTASSWDAEGAQPGPLCPKPIRDGVLCWYALEVVRAAFSPNASPFSFRRKRKEKNVSAVAM